MQVYAINTQKYTKKKKLVVVSLESILYKINQIYGSAYFPYQYNCLLSKYNSSFQTILAISFFQIKSYRIQYLETLYHFIHVY